MKGLKHWCGGLAVLQQPRICSQVIGNSFVIGAHKFRRAQGKIVIGDGFGARHQTKGKAGRIKIPEPLQMFKPDKADIGGVLGFLNLLAALGLEMFEGISNHQSLCMEGFVQVYRVFHGQLGARTDGEMCRCFGIANQHDVILHPALATHHGKLPPQRTVCGEPVALQFFCKHLLHEAGGFCLAHVFDPCLFIGDRVCFQHPGGTPRLVLVAVGNEDAFLALFEKERESIKGAGGTHPGKTVGAQVRFGAEMLGKCIADAAVDAIRGHNQIIVSGEGGHIIEIGFKLESDPKL